MSDAKVEAAVKNEGLRLTRRGFLLGAVIAAIGGGGYLLEIGLLNHVGLGELVTPNQTAAVFFGGVGVAGGVVAFLSGVSHLGISGKK